jgi:hypothetical protein
MCADLCSYRISLGVASQKSVERIIIALPSPSYEGSGGSRSIPTMREAEERTMSCTDKQTGMAGIEQL